MIAHFCYSLGPTSCVPNDFVNNFEFCQDQKIYYVKGGPVLGSEVRLTLRSFIKLMKRKKIIMHFHSVHFFWVSFFSFFKKNRSVLTVHTSWQNYSSIHKMMALFSIFMVRKVIFVSDASFLSFPLVVRKAFKKKIRVIDNSFNYEKIIPLPFLEKKGWVVCGRLVESKRVDLSIEFFLKYSNPSDVLHVIGDGVKKEALQRAYYDFIESGRIVFTGSIEREKVYAILEKALYYISMSEIEGLPVSVLEAMASNCIVFLSYIPAHLIFNDCEHVFMINDIGFISKEGSDAIEDRRMEPTTRCFLESRFGVEQFVRSYKDVYGGL